MRSLTLKPSFAGDVKKRNKDRLGLKSQPQGKDKKKVKKRKTNQHDSKNGRDSKRQSVIRTSPYTTNVLTNKGSDIILSP